MSRTLFVLALAAALPATGLIAAAAGSECDGDIVVTADGFEGEAEIPGSPSFGFLGLSERTSMEVVIDTDSSDAAAVGATVTIDWEHAHNDLDLYVYDEEGTEYVGGKFNFIGGDESGEPSDPIFGIQYGGSYEETATGALDSCETLTIEVSNYDAFDPEETATLTIELGEPAASEE